MSRIRMDVPFSMIPEWVVKSEMSSHAKVLYAALARYANLPNGALPSRKTLAEDWLHVSLNTLNRALDELIGEGALTRTVRPGHTNLYVLHNLPTRGKGRRSNLPIGGEGSVPTRGEGKKDKKRDSSLREGESTSPARPRDELWDALAEQFGEPATHGAKSLRGKMVKSFREAGATAQEIKARAIRYARVMPPGTLLTETALEKHWPLLASPEIKTPPCEECGVGGGLHVAGCTRVAV